jgi:hypothetical protein
MFESIIENEATQIINFGQKIVMIMYIKHSKLLKRIMLWIC